MGVRVSRVSGCHTGVSWGFSGLQSLGLPGFMGFMGFLGLVGFKKARSRSFRISLVFGGFRGSRASGLGFRA